MTEFNRECYSSVYADVVSTFSLMTVLIKGGSSTQLRKMGYMGLAYGFLPMFV